MANIAISELQSETTSLSDDDLLLVSKSSSNNTLFESVKMRAKVISDLIDEKTSVLSNTVLSLRNEIFELIQSQNSLNIQTADYCILDGNSCIEAKDITTYDNIVKYEIRLHFDSSARSGFTWLYEYSKGFYSAKNVPNHTNPYNNTNYWKQSCQTAYNEHYNVLVQYGNAIAQSVAPYMVGGDVCDVDSVIAFNPRLAANDIDHTLIIDKSSCYITLDETQGSKPFPTLNVEGHSDYLLSCSDYGRGFIGKLYYIKCYDSSGDEIAHLVPAAAAANVFLRDTINNTNIAFRGTGTPRIPVVE